MDNDNNIVIDLEYLKNEIICDWRDADENVPTIALDEIEITNFEVSLGNNGPLVEEAIFVYKHIAYQYSVYHPIECLGKYEE